MVKKRRLLRRKRKRKRKFDFEENKKTFIFFDTLDFLTSICHPNIIDNTTIPVREAWNGLLFLCRLTLPVRIDIFRLSPSVFKSKNRACNNDILMVMNQSPFEKKAPPPPYYIIQRATSENPTGKQDDIMIWPCLGLERKKQVNATPTSRRLAAKSNWKNWPYIITTTRGTGMRNLFSYLPGTSMDWSWSGCDIIDH